MTKKRNFSSQTHQCQDVNDPNKKRHNARFHAKVPKLALESQVPIYRGILGGKEIQKKEWFIKLKLHEISSPKTKICFIKKWNCNVVVYSFHQQVVHILNFILFFQFEKSSSKHPSGTPFSETRLAIEEFPKGKKAKSETRRKRRRKRRGRR